MREFLYILTMQSHDGRQATWSGVITPAEGATRERIWLDLRATIAQAQPTQDQREAVAAAPVVFFSLEPNAL
ncbi:hypothetical protein ABWI13_32240 [Streptomyces koyangensis]|uniref:Uncharacterized protein n=1 Tax=Streptomyces lunalinharesii TaxID=333384 RepID=A0ABP6FRP9_9ACTN